MAAFNGISRGSKMRMYACVHGDNDGVNILLRVQMTFLSDNFVLGAAIFLMILTGCLLSKRTKHFDSEFKSLKLHSIEGYNDEMNK